MTGPRRRAGTRNDVGAVDRHRRASELWSSQPAAEQTVRAAIAAAAALSTDDGEVSIVLTDDKAIRVLNRDWRGIDKPTNVLSFPAPKSKTGGHQDARRHRHRL